ncbi:acyltransferase family protein [Lacticaseibacillus paracasei]|uniref:acyltransferase family protein n=1 Tax=Lacticaseibacillus paracasei TaxID=1597 RepID=UPI0006666191|nr:acyltransferase [Lacticaseibacillus paracasei]
MRKRIGFVTNIRALAIILVVFGHSIIIYSSAWGIYQSSNQVQLLNGIKSLINLVQMPLFISVSGFLFANNYITKSIKKVLKQKAERILIPYVVFFWFWMIPMRFLVGYYNHINVRPSFKYLIFNSFIMGQDNGHLWFLPCLFFCFPIGYYVFQYFDKIKFSMLVKSIFSVLFFWFVSMGAYVLGDFISFMPLHDLGEQFIWFFLGFVVRRNVDVIRNIQIKYKLGTTVLGVVLGGLSVSGIISQVRFLIVFSSMVSILLVLLAYTIISNRSKNIMNRLAADSFGIYLFHSPLVYVTYTCIPNASPFIVVFLNFVVFGGLAWLLAFKIQTTKLRWIFGML